MATIKKIQDTIYIVCPKCGYNNEKKRFQLFGYCLRCNHIIEQKIYLRRLLYLSKRRRDNEQYRETRREEKRYKLH